MERRRPWMAFGAFVLVALSFRSWYAYGLGAPVHAENAWSSPRWAVAVLAGLAATLIWFGAVARLSDRSRPVVSAALLVLSVGLMAQEAHSVHHRTYRFAIVEVGFANPDGSSIGTSPQDRFYIDFQPAHHVAVVTLAGMLALAATAAAGAQTRRR